MKTLQKPQAGTSLSFYSTHLQACLFALALSHHVEIFVSTAWQIWGNVEPTLKAWHRISHTLFISHVPDSGSCSCINVWRKVMM